MLPILFTFAAGLALGSLACSYLRFIEERRRIKLQLKRAMALEYRYSIKQIGKA